MSDLIERLERTQDIVLAIRPTPTPDSFRLALERGFVPVRFPNTRGGTELGIKLDRDSVWSSEELSKGAGQVQIAGELSLDYTRVRFQGTIDIATMKGSGRLEPIEATQTKVRRNG